MSERTVFYSVHVTNRASRERGTSWVWSKPFASQKEARAHRQRFIDEGSCVLGFVVVFDAEGRRVLHGQTWPRSAARVIEHYLELDDGLADAEEEARE